MSDRQLANTYMAAMRIWDAQKADGVSLEDRQASFAKSIRAAWPTSEQPHYFLCAQCEDYGWIWRKCHSKSCGRPFRLPKQHSDDHTGKGECPEGHLYCVPCHVCEKGQAFGRSLQKQPPIADPSDFTQSGRSKPMARMGR